MPTPSITILSTLEHLGSYGGAADVYFGVTLQIASDTVPSTDPEKSLLCPWFWDRNKLNIRLWKDAGSGANPVTSQLGKIVKTDDDAELAVVLAANRKTVGDFLNADYATLQKANASDNFAVLRPGEDYTTSKNGGGRYRWPAHLAQVTRYPYPIPHSLNLSVFFSVPAGFVPKATPGANPATPPWFFAAPEFSFTSTDGVETYTLIDPVSQGPALPVKPVIINYSNALNRSVSCQTLAIAATSFIVTSPATRGSTALSFSDAYVNLQLPEQLNWQDLLATQCSELFDTSARLLTALRETSFAPSPLNGSTQAALDAIAQHSLVFTRLFVAALSNVGNPGVIKPVDIAHPTLFSSQFNLWLQSNPQYKAKADSFYTDLTSILKDAPVVDLTKPDTFRGWCETLKVVPGFDAFGPLLDQSEFAGSISDGDLDAQGKPVTTLTQKQLQALFTKLDSMHVLMTQSDSLSALLFVRWNQDVATQKKPDDWMAMWSSFRSFLQSQNLRPVVAMANLRRVNPLPAITQVWDSTKRQTIRNQIATSLSTFFALDCNQLPLADAIRKALFDPGQPWIEAQTILIVPDALSAAQKKRPSSTSEGITLVLDTLAPPPGMDILTETSGFCLLGREETNPPGEWQCLNVGIVQKPAVATPVAVPEISLSLPTVIPVPLHDQDGMRHAMVTYNNQPLMMQSPAAGFGPGMAKTTGSDAASNLGLVYLHPYLVDANSPYGKLPGLKFGSKYQFAAARVRSCGALPSALALSANPGRLAKNLKGSLPHFLGAVEYKRTVPIGALRFASEEGATNQSLKLPPIPEGVNPLARELNLQASGQGDREPFLLLSSFAEAPKGTNQFVFSIRPPAIDLQTWDRYVAKDLSPDTRINIWTDFHKLATLGSGDATIDDPAVRGVVLSLESLSGPRVTGGPATVNWTFPGITTSLESFRAKAQAISIIAQPAIMSASITGTTVNLPPGGIYRLTFTLQLDGKAAGRMADTGVTRQPETFLIETASGDLPLPSVLRAAFTTPNTTSKLEFRLALDSKKEGMLYIGSANVATQEWRWNGRPQMWTSNGKPGIGFPFDYKTQLDSDPILQWESIAFSPRQNSDATLRTLSRDLDSATGTRLLTASEDISPNFGARYFRSYVTVYNRYGVLVPEGKRMAVSSSADSGNTNEPFHWSRSFVLARLPQNLSMPMPAVKLILPLTESLQEDSGPRRQDAASLLVSVQGPSFTLAGLAEDVEVRVVQLPDHKYQYGPDPIEPFHAGFHAASTPAIGPLRGPVGHTFDESDINPLWVNSSFVLPPPVPQPTFDARNMFAQVQFRRRLSKAYTVSANIPEEVNASAWTDPYWVQFLPSRLFSVLLKEKSFTETYLSVIGQKLSLLAKPNTSLVQLQPDDTKNTHLQHFLLLTEQVPDLLGRSGQERFVALCERAVNSTDWALPYGTNSPPPGKAVARLLEVQVPFYRKNPDTALSSSQLLTEMFRPSDSEADAKARIIGISPPIFELNMEPCSTPGGHA
jgi:hypothetical protein